MTCPCGKIAHPTERLAEAHLTALMAKRRPAARRLKTYQCASGSWHVGHLPKVKA